MAISGGGDGAVFIENMDRRKFLISFFAFGIPLLVCTLASAYLLKKAQFKLRLLPSVVSMWQWNWLRSDVRLEKLLFWLCVLIGLLLITPTVFILVWGIYVYVNINHLLGYAIFIILMCFQIISFGFLHWRLNEWRLDKLTKICVFVAFVLVWTFQLWTAYLQKPMTYFSLSMVYIGFNMLPMILLTYSIAQCMTKPFAAYASLGEEPLKDYEKFIEEEEKKTQNQLQRLNTGIVQEQQEMKEADDQPVNPVAIVSPHDYQTFGVYGKIMLYLVAISLLLAYSISVAYIKSSDGTRNSVGWITSGVIVILDITIFLCVYGGKITSPLHTCFYQVLCRFVLIIFGDTYWFVGHSIMYIILSVFFAFSIIDNLIPLQDEKQQKSNIISDVLKSAAAQQPELVIETPAPVASTEQLVGFIKAGKFSNSNVGKFVFKYVEYEALVILTVAFLIDLIINSKVSREDFHFAKDHAQYLVGCLALFLTGILTSSQVILRLYRNNNWLLSWRVLGLSLLQWLISVGCGIWLYKATDSVIIISFACFLPPIVYFAVFAFIQWVKNDYEVWPSTPEEKAERNKQKMEELMKKNPELAAKMQRKHENDNNTSYDKDGRPILAGDEQKTDESSGEFAPVVPESSPASPRFAHIDFDLGKYNWIKKYKTIVSATISFILVLGLGSCIAANTKPAYIGYSISAVILILASTAIPIIEWFNSFEISKNMIIQLILSGAMFIAFIVIFWVQGLDKAKDNNSLALLFLLFMYPTFVIFIFAIIKYRDDKWVRGDFVTISFILCGAFISGFFIILGVVYSPWEIGISLLVVFLLLCFSAVIIPIIREQFPWMIKWMVIVGLCALIAFSAGVASQDGMGFIGFSLGWAILFLCSLLACYQAHKKSQTISLTHLFSPNIFPVYLYNLTPGLKNPLKPDNLRVYLVYSTLFISTVWGVIAVFFIEDSWIGLGVVSLSVIFLAIYTMDSTTKPLVQLASAVRYLVEGSPLYFSAVKKAKVAAFKSQLTSVKTTSIAPEETLKDGSSSTHSVSSSVTFHTGQSAAQRSESRLSTAHEAIVASSTDTLLLDEQDLITLGITDPAKALSDLNWKGLYNIFAELRKSIPYPAPFVLCAGNEAKPASVSFALQSLTRRRANELLLKLDHHIALLHGNWLRFVTQVQAELILGVESMKAERETEILTMLRETGNSKATAQLLRSIKPGSPERMQLEHALIAWKLKQEKLKAERARKKEEELAETRRRLEEEHRLELEKKEAERRQREEASRMDSDALRRKQEEILRLQALEEQKKQDEIRRQYEQQQLEQRLEAERIAREQAEAEARRRNEEEAARLQRENKERELQQFRALQEAQRLADEKRERERLERERILREQQVAEAARAEAARQAEIASLARITDAYNRKVCTVTTTNPREYVLQKWYECVTCGMTNGQGVCEVCKQTCHKGHQLVDKGTLPTYCDCGASGCESATGKKAAPGVDAVIAQCRRTKQKFVDKDFPPTATALVKDPRNTKKQTWVQLQWARPEEFQGVKSPSVFSDKPDSNDIKQGAIGDCWFMSALSVLAQRPVALSNIFITKEHNPEGVYAVNFFKNGRVETVIVDSYFPVNQNRSPAFGHSNDPNELWVMILEKCYAKLHKCLSFGTLVRVHNSTIPVSVELLDSGMQLLDENNTPVAIEQLAADSCSTMLQLHYAGGSHTVTPDHLVTLRCGSNPSTSIRAWSGGSQSLVLMWIDANTAARQSRNWRLESPTATANNSYARLVAYSNFDDAYAAANAWGDFVIAKGKTGITEAERASLDKITVEAIGHQFVSGSVSNAAGVVGTQKRLNLCMTRANKSSRTYNHFVIADDDSDAHCVLMPTLPASMSSHLVQFAHWWLAQASAAGIASPLRLGELFEVSANDLRKASTHFRQLHGIPQVTPQDSPNLSNSTLDDLESPTKKRKIDEEATIVTSPSSSSSGAATSGLTVSNSSSSSSTSGHFNQQMALIQQFMQSKGLSSSDVARVNQTSSDVVAAHSSTQSSSQSSSSGMHKSRKRTDIPPATPEMIAEVQQWVRDTKKGWGAAAEHFKGRVRNADVHRIVSAMTQARKKLGLKQGNYDVPAGAVSDNALAFKDASVELAEDSDESEVCVDYARRVVVNGSLPAREFQYPAVQLNDIVDFAYMLHNPLVAESMVNARGKKARTILQLEKVWNTLGIDPSQAGGQVMITEMNPIATGTGEMNAADPKYDQICMSAMNFALGCKCKRIIVFGTPSYNRWMETIDQCDGVMSSVLEVDADTGDVVMRVSLDDDSTVMVHFCGHPSASFLYANVVLTIAAAHQIPVSAQLRTELDAWQRVKFITSIEEVKAKEGEEPLKFIRIKVAGSGRFLLADGCVTHNCFESIEAGFVDQALVDLTGGIGSRIDMSKDEVKQQIRTGVLFKQLLNFRKSGFLLGAGSPAGSDSESNASSSGIVQGHAYSLLDAQEVDGNQLVKLRNPWGRKEWTGDWSDKSDKWTRRIKAKLEYVDVDDGAFWMSMLDFSIHFEDIYVCRFFDADAGWKTTPPLTGRWSISDGTAGGCTNFESVKSSPQFLLQIDSPCTVVLNLSQDDTRGTLEKPKAISIEIYQNKGQRITRTRTGPLIASNPESYIFRREVSLEAELKPSPTPYTVLISTFNENEEANWALQIYSTANIGFKEAPAI